MEIRSARVGDVEAIRSLINYYAERDVMLFRSVADIYENLQSFAVAEVDGEVVGCGSLQIIWSDLAEVKSLAVAEGRVGSGVGRAIVERICETAVELGISRVFALTLTPDFFEKLGFSVVEKESLPMKVWSDCARCTKQQNCDEIAVLRHVLS